MATPRNNTTVAIAYHGGGSQIALIAGVLEQDTEFWIESSGLWPY
jgi:hypothetical protein